MKIGVLDSDGRFDHEFFVDKKLEIVRKVGHGRETEIGAEFTHGEYVCSHILKENPEAEIILVPIINTNMKCSVQDMIDGIQLLIEYQVDMINLSIGDEYHYHQELEEICKIAWEKGILIVAAHSNRKVEATYPAEFPFVLGVSCTDEGTTSRIMKFDETKNEVIFSSGFFSIYHLEIPKLLQGNSFACARITGLLSYHKEKYQVFLREFENSIFNIYYQYASLKQKRCLFYTNRGAEPLQQRFIQEVTNTIICLAFENAIQSQEIAIEGWEVLFIDHSSYKEIFPYKSVIQQYALQEPDKEVVLRFPLFNLEERLKLYNERGIIIYQFFI